MKKHVQSHEKEARELRQFERFSRYPGYLVFYAEQTETRPLKRSLCQFCDENIGVIASTSYCCLSCRYECPKS
ncbi:MAG TPA: hypothetical protein VF596_04065 [Pyrinomonadaceae bacterium]|jgi:hypothetical protein